MRVRVFLTEYKVKQNALADAVGVSTGTVSKWVSGKQPMSLADIERVSNALGVRPEVFLSGEGPTPPPPNPTRDTNPTRDKTTDQTRVVTVRHRIGHSVAAAA